MARSMLIALIALVVLSAAQQARAERQTEENDEVGLTTTDLQLRPNQQERILGQVFMLPVYFFAGVTLHEGSHALSIWSVGWRVTGFEPYPHRIWTEDGRGERKRDFVWGCVWFDAGSRTENWRGALVMVAPYLTDIAIFTAADLALQYGVNPHSAAAPFLLFGAMVTPLFDFFTALVCTAPTCDLSRLAEASGVPRGAMLGIGFSMAFVGIWRCLHHFRRLFMEPRGVAERRERTLSVSPFLGEGMAGAGVSGHF